jgi:hypothetical protein
MIRNAGGAGNKVAPAKRQQSGYEHTGWDYEKGDLQQAQTTKA